MKRVDLYLGGDSGLWALQQVPVEYVGQVFARDEDIIQVSRSRGLKAWQENPNNTSFKPSGIAFSVHYPIILKEGLIAKYRKLYNLHPGYLPWGRGYYPIFWALWEQTPAGATLHEITARLDEGPIVSQIQVEYYPDDAGGSLFRRVREAEKTLFNEYWPKIIAGETIPSFLQPEGGSYHSKKEFFELKRRCNLDSMSACDLIRLIRCFTFPGYTGLEITLGQRKFELHLEQLEKE